MLSDELNFEGWPIIEGEALWLSARHYQAQHWLCRLRHIIRPSAIL